MSQANNNRGATYARALEAARQFLAAREEAANAWLEFSRRGGMADMLAYWYKVDEPSELRTDMSTTPDGFTAGMAAMHVLCVETADQTVNIDYNVALLTPLK